MEKKSQKPTLAEIVCQFLVENQDLLQIAAETVRLEGAYKIIGSDPMQIRTQLTQNKERLFSAFKEKQMPFQNEKQMMEELKKIEFV